MVQRAAVHERQYPVSLNIRYVKLPNCHLQKQPNGPIERDFTTKYKCFQAANKLLFSRALLLTYTFVYHLIESTFSLCVTNIKPK